MSFFGWECCFHVNAPSSWSLGGSHDSVSLDVPGGWKEPEAGADESLHHQIVTNAGFKSSLSSIIYHHRPDPAPDPSFKAAFLLIFHPVQPGLPSRLHRSQI